MILCDYVKIITLLFTFFNKNIRYKKHLFDDWFKIDVVRNEYEEKSFNHVKLIKICDSKKENKISIASRS